MVELDRIADGVNLAREAHPRIRVTYAVKASYHRPILDAVRAAGAGVSAFSEMEMALARTAKFAPYDIVYNGVGREGADLATAVDAGVTVNLESLAELRGLLHARRADASAGRIGFRVNGCVPGESDTLGKYGVLGISVAQLPTVADLLRGSGLVLGGVSFHHLANRLDGTAHLDTLDRLIPALAPLSGHPAVALDYIDVGGGLASRLEVGDESAVEMFRALADRIDADLDCTTILELGRFLVADAESLLSRVVDMRTSGGVMVAILDATTNYLIPAPGHRFRVERLEPLAQGETRTPVRFVDRLGSTICENHCGPLRPGTLVGVLNAGAYAGVMKEHFVYPLPDVSFVRDDAVIATSPAGGDKAVRAHHHWPET
ncbi:MULTISPECIES: diaminopimelate decarboxylase family protein [Streptomyces]|uniref:Putative decarboxylase n=1 Tax=Streptomyces scabiei (strain 87.22) TaxID=680198 RepID=C9Z2B8_STRSW|nr:MULTISPECIES: decarboxylase [Streptomyces]KFG09225.1 hypothetical protein IQ61_09555 [Streptomyces scabiei]MDX2537118.1 hypothetical protein [Streptomyces scabiei]MDX2575492.1 hypothetical protein [Streptomyces scabiei]MDX2653028.1 hypothetical protein [Streptomyces scabiei]MDX2685021.1 hypothetical protein [Streptomyces scabiei]